MKQSVFHFQYGVSPTAALKRVNTAVLNVSFSIPNTYIPLLGIRCKPSARHLSEILHFWQHLIQTRICFKLKRFAEIATNTFDGSSYWFIHTEQRKRTTTRFPKSWLASKKYNSLVFLSKVRLSVLLYWWSIQRIYVRLATLSTSNKCYGTKDNSNRKPTQNTPLLLQQIVTKMLVI